MFKLKWGGGAGAFPGWNQTLNSEFWLQTLFGFVWVVFKTLLVTNGLGFLPPISLTVSEIYPFLFKLSISKLGTLPDDMN